MDQPSYGLTDEQREQLRPAVAKVSEGLAELHERLSDLGFGEEGDFSCTQNDGCEFFVTPEQLPRNRCARPTCGHSFRMHRVR